MSPLARGLCSETMDSRSPLGEDSRVVGTRRLPETVPPRCGYPQPIQPTSTVTTPRSPHPMRLHLASLAGALALIALTGPARADEQKPRSPLRLIPEADFLIQA